MKKLIGVFFILIFLSLGNGTAEAKLSVAGPVQMLETADLIIVGTVKEREYSEDRRQVVIGIDSVLKGSIEEKELILVRNRESKYGWLSFDFPPVDNRVLVLLSKGEAGQGYGLHFDLNNVAMVDKQGRVEVYKGSTINGKPPEMYSQVYQKFFNEKYILAKAKDSQERVTGEKPAPDRQWSLALFFGGLVVIVLFMMAFLKNRK